MQITPKQERLLPDGWYEATIGRVEEKETKHGTRLMTPFLVEDDGGTVEIMAWLTFSDHPKSNMVKWAKALLGNRPFDTSEFSNLEAEVLIEEGEDAEGSPKNYVRKVRKPKGGGKTKTKAGDDDDAKVDIEENMRNREAAEDDFEDIPL